jgi:uroporphyrinogen III methyltransferase/synthase
MKTGRVYLVGAGPGDPGLITRRGEELISRAEVIIHDDLIDERLLESFPRNAEIIYAGKRRGMHLVPQALINSMLVEKAKEGKTVVRLKGGDPFLFGRGGEEVIALSDAGILFEVVPGVTSTVAVPAYAGIPVTHRNVASTFTVITGHEYPGKPDSGINWKCLAEDKGTLVFVMGVSNLAEIVKRLTENGKSARTPVALIGEGTRPTQKTVTGTLANIVDRVKKSKLKTPAVILVGNVVKFNKKLDWFTTRPLSGKRILVTRATGQAEAMSRVLSDAGAIPVELPVIGIKAIEDFSNMDKAISGISRYSWVVFTSVHGVDAFFNRLYEKKLDARDLSKCSIAAIGPATAAKLREKGVVSDMIPKKFSAAGILSELKKRNVSGKSFLLPRSDLADPELAQGIMKLGGKVNEIAAYHTVSLAEKTGKGKKPAFPGDIDVITFTSSSAVRALVNIFKDTDAMNRSKTACIGNKTAETATAAGIRVDIVSTVHTIDGLVSAIEDYFRKEA